MPATGISSPITAMVGVSVGPRSQSNQSMLGCSENEWRFELIDMHASSRNLVQSLTPFHITFRYAEIMERGVIQVGFGRHEEIGTIEIITLRRLIRTRVGDQIAVEH